jgi:hypothetical protein
VHKRKRGKRGYPHKDCHTPGASCDVPPPTALKEPYLVGDSNHPTVIKYKGNVKKNVKWYSHFVKQVWQFLEMLNTELPYDSGISLLYISKTYENNQQKLVRHGGTYL